MDFQTYLNELSDFNAELQQKQAVDENKTLEYENLKNGLIEGLGLPSSFGIGSSALSSEGVKSALKQLLKTGNDDIDSATSDLIDGGNPVDIASKLISQKITQPMKDAYGSLKDKLTNTMNEGPEEGTLDPLSRVQSFVNRVQDSSGDALDEVTKTFYTLKRNIAGDKINPDDGGDIELQNFAEGAPEIQETTNLSGVASRLLARVASNIESNDVTGQVASRISQLRQQLPTLGEADGQNLSASGLLEQAKTAIAGKADEVLSGVRQTVENRINDFTDNISDRVADKINQLQQYGPQTEAEDFASGLDEIARLPSSADILQTARTVGETILPDVRESISNLPEISMNLPTATENIENGVNLTKELANMPDNVVNGINDTIDNATGTAENLVNVAKTGLSDGVESALGAVEGVADSDPITALAVGLPVALGGLIASFAELFKKNHSPNEADTLSLPVFQADI